MSSHRAPKGGASRLASTTRTGLLLKAVNDQPISALIVEQVRRLIHEGKLTPGDKLPPERELCERFGVSRVTVREALRVLEAGGLVKTRVGTGATVKEPTADRVEASIVDLLTLSSVSARDVAEVRLLLEVGIIPLLCAHADADDYAALQGICDRHEAALAAKDYDVALSAEFHSRLVTATHNTAFEMLIHSFHGPLPMALLSTQRAAPEMDTRGLREHRAILAAVQTGDAATGSRIMRDHLTRIAGPQSLPRATPADHGPSPSSRSSAPT